MTASKVIGLERQYASIKLDINDLRGTRSNSVGDITFFIEKIIEYLQMDDGQPALVRQGSQEDAG